MVQYEVGDVFLRPFLEEAGVAVLALGINPHVETLCHNHHSEAVAQIHLHCRRHIVRGAYGVTSHLFHQFYLAYQCSLVDCGPKRTEVVVQADTLYLASLAVKHETAVLADAYGTDAKVCYGLVNNLIVFHQA